MRLHWARFLGRLGLPAKEKRLAFHTLGIAALRRIPISTPIAVEL
jgi:hypothetical protein